MQTQQPVGFGSLLRQYRLEGALTQQELAERARISVEAVSTLERGARRRPQRQTVEMIAKALDLSAKQHGALLEAAAALSKPRPRVVRPAAPSAVSLEAMEGPPWLVPDAIRTRYFTGREGLLATLRSQLDNRRRIALSGLGGVGKTQAAIEYAVRHRAEYPMGVFWVTADTESAITAGFAEIARILCLVPAELADHAQIIRAAMAWLNKNEGWLLILDNVEDRINLVAFVPKHENGHLLITSRESVFQELGIARAIEIPDFSQSEAVQFLLTRTGRERLDLEQCGGAAEQESVAQLAADLGNLPLALEQAAAYIAETNAAFADYLASFRKRRIELLERSKNQIVHETIAVTWAANFAAVEHGSPGAAEALRVSAFLAPEDIPFELFSVGASVLGGPIASALADPGDALAVGEVLRPLMRFSLIRTNVWSRTFNVHRLVQEVVRSAISADQLAYIELAAAALDRSFPEPEFSVWPRCERLVPHARAALSTVPDNTTFLPAGSLADKCGLYLWERGNYREAAQLQMRALAIRERILGPDHPDIARSLNRLGGVYWKQGRHQEAEAVHRRALAIRERALGPFHPDVAKSLNNVAAQAECQGKHEEAVRLFMRALGIWEKALGTDHPHCAATITNLAEVYRNQGDHKNAEILNVRALVIRENALGSDHPHVAHSLNNVAETYLQQGRCEEAKVLHFRALEIRKRAFGSEHPEIVETLNNLGSVYCSQGQYDKAAELHTRALAMGEKTLGHEHPDIASTLIYLAKVYLKRESWKEAERLYKRALAVLNKTRDVEDRHVLAILSELANRAKLADRTKSTD